VGDGKLRVVVGPSSISRRSQIALFPRGMGDGS